MTSRLQRATLYLVFFYIQSRVPISSSDQGAACCCLTSVHRSWSYPQQSQCKIRTMSRWFKITSTSILLRFHNIGLHQTRVRFLSSGTNTITTSRPSRTESITTRNNTTIHWWWDEATKIDTWYYSRCLKLRCFNRFQSWFINISYQFGYQNIIIKYLNFNTIKYCDQTSIHQTSISQPPQNAGKSGHIIGSTNVLLGTLHGVARQLQQLPCETRWVGVSWFYWIFGWKQKQKCHICHQPGQKISKIEKTHHFWGWCQLTETSNSQTKDSWKEPGKSQHSIVGSRAPDLHLSFSPGLDLSYCPMSG